jgi:type IV fimbrial biogenesis protein FimT
VPTVLAGYSEKMAPAKHLMIAQRGVTLIETMITVAIGIILIALAMPSFSTYLSNLKVRTSAEALLAGMQMARGEAVRQNTTIQLLLTPDTAISANQATTNISTSGTNWIVRTTPGNTFIEGRSGAEGSGSTSQVQINGTVGSVTFNGFGGTTVGALATFQFTNPTGGACAAAAGPIRCLNVVVTTGGRIRMCDPAVTAAQILAGDTRGC